MINHLLRWSALLLLGWTSIAGPVTAENTPAPEKAAPRVRPLGVAILDFTTIDLRAKERFLDQTGKKIEIPERSTLNTADRLSINRVMQGYVRLVDTRSAAATDDANRALEVHDRLRAERDNRAIHDTMTKGETRPVIIGADYLASYLGKHADTFRCIDPGLLSRAVEELRKEAGNPLGFGKALALGTGAEFLITGTVSDLRHKTVAFKGYGIETRNDDYQLDVLIKVIDLADGMTVFSKVYTGNYRQQQRPGVLVVNPDIFQNLMTGALEQAAQELYEAARPDGKGILRRQK